MKCVHSSWWVTASLLSVAACSTGEIGIGATMPLEEGAARYDDSGAPIDRQDGNTDVPREDGGAVAPAGDGGSGPTATSYACPALTSAPGTATVFVDANFSGTEAGSKIAPYRTLAKALSSAATGGVIFVAAGTYKENLDVPNKGLTIYGGFNAAFSARTDGCATVIEAASASKAVFTASYSVKAFSLDGVTVRKGAHGIYVAGDATVGATYTITSSVFSNNGQTSSNGGGAYLSRVSAIIRKSIFVDNIGARGAALALDGNSLVAEENLFERNIGYSDHGGGLYISPTKATLVRNTFKSNEIGKGISYGGWGGGVIVYSGGTAGTADFSYNVFTNNLAGVGGALFVDDGAKVTMSHDLLYRNRTYKSSAGEVRGAAIYVDGTGSASGGSSITLDQVTVVNNIYDNAGVASTKTRGSAIFVERSSKVSIKNSIFWNNGSDVFFVDSGCSIDMKYSVAPNKCSGGGTCSVGTGVLQPTDVFFVNEAKDDYHLKSTAGHYAAGAWIKDLDLSPAIDKADPAQPYSTEPTPNGARADVGAFGGTTEASKTP